jgi:hypothetical protein
MKVILDQYAFIYASAHSSRFSLSGPLGMVDYFVLHDFANGFDIFYGMWAHCSRSHSTCSIAFTFCISTVNVGKTIWRHRSHHDR